MADSEHLEKLSEGVLSWNAWRKENPHIHPDLSGDSEKELVLAEELKESPIWTKLDPARFSHWDSAPRLILDGVDLSNANLMHCNLRRSYLEGANFANAKLDFANLDHAIMPNCSLRGASLHRASLQATHLVGSDLVGANFEQARINGCNLYRADVDGACFKQIQWDPHHENARKLPSSVDLIKDAPKLKDYWRHQLYVEDQDPVHHGAPVRILDWFAVHRPMSKPIWLVMLFLGALAGLIASDGASMDFGAQGPNPPINNILLGALMGAVLGLFFASYWGDVARHKIWKALGFGWSWENIVILAFFLILLYGALYKFVFIPWGDVVLIDTGSPDPSVQFFYAWYIAAMGFSTLGVTDLVMPTSGVGQIFLISNVLMGFFVFGLLIATIGRSFQGR